ncbi:MAG: hypothetical protein UV74_C0013G0194 [Candidatus Woesebacteria bacterium GW2011_GWB1_43_14]|uniref:DNA alkylation repair protein n=1 Tax=Candidatus Woesebacteria bacterium GW2011_GWB1_43_14 TaxID=1618578 RepID=A0A0G1DHK6_9BACT|nr:MAG: alkylation repair enzyme protein [Candidatus Woesebacteria bacterium GW2011_GWC1_42_9]KKS97072.1 MAG: hypothetical protein UV74_C0013G0194 [Candidatus Woesebacteria bacterium GW2011_GWB1_43_14]
MNKLHQEILKGLKKLPQKDSGHFDINKYLGSPRKYYGTSTPDRRKMMKDWYKKHKDINFSEFQSLLDSLYKGESIEERFIAGSVLEHYSDLRTKLSPQRLKKWVSGLIGWAEIDTQISFSGGEILDKWEDWGKALTDFSNSNSISLRRASLVLLVKPVRDVRDKKLLKLAFANIGRLKHERDILITKAISWLLRDMIKNYRREVQKYLSENRDSLPAIALREATRKLKTGRK